MPSAARAELAPGRRARWLVIGIGLLLIASFIGEAAFDGWRLHQQIVAANHRELGNLSRALANEASRIVQRVDGLLGETARWYESTGTARGADSVGAELARRGAGVNEVRTLTIVDATGRQRFRSRDAGDALATVADRPYFKVQQASRDAGLFINAPVVSRTDKVAALVLSRRLETADGRFDGIVTATVTLQQLRDAYSAIDLGASSTLVLTLEDGTLVVRQPSIADIEGSLKMPEIVALRAGPDISRMISSIDHRPKLVAAVAVPMQPLLLAISRDEVDALRPWVDEMRSAMWRTGLLSLAVLLGMAIGLGQLRRLQASASALRESENRYAMAMEAANEGHAEWNLPSGAVFQSDKWRSLHGYAPGEVASSSPVGAQRLDPDDARLVQAAIDEHIAGRSQAIEVDYRVRHLDGEWHWIHARGRCMRNAEGVPLRLFCSAVDITERKRAEAERAAFDSRLAETHRLEALGTLAGGIAHDFNNILGAILGFGEMAQQGAEPGSALRRHVDRVMQSGTRARLLVKCILDFSRSGLSDRTPVHLQSVVEEVVAMLVPSLPAGLRVEVNLDCPDSAVTGDATQLHQVVMNLASNAVQAMGDSGSLRIGLHCADIAATRPLLQGELRVGRYLRLEVADDGPGIPPDVQSRMFDPFFTTRKAGEGTGLGLSVVHGVVAGMNGAIDVETSAAGTAITVWLPSTGMALPPARAQVVDWPRGNGQAVMVVDDEPALVELAEELLAGLGYEPVGYADAESALDAFLADPDRFDAVITDEMLPGLQGSEFAARLLTQRPTLPVILMSGNLSEAAERSARAAGVRATLHKPLALRELAAQLAAALPDFN